MTVVNHDLRCVDGKTIYSIPEKGGSTTQGNLALPNVYSQSATALYDIGTKFVDGERTFHYAYAGSALLTMRGSLGYVARTQSAQPSYDTSQAAGVGTVASPFKIDGTGASTPAKNAYAGQYILIQGTALGSITMRIVSNSQGLATGAYTTELVLDQPTPTAVAANLNCDIFPSRYADVRSAVALDASMYPILGVALIAVTSARYFWLQTWGPCFVTCYLEELGDTNYERTAVFYASDATIWPCDHAWGTSTTTSAQLAGYTLATNGAGSEWIMLMLDR